MGGSGQTRRALHLTRAPVPQQGQRGAQAADCWSERDRDGSGRRAWCRSCRGATGGKAWLPHSSVCCRGRSRGGCGHRPGRAKAMATKLRDAPSDRLRGPGERWRALARGVASSLAYLPAAVATASAANARATRAGGRTEAGALDGPRAYCPACAHSTPTSLHTASTRATTAGVAETPGPATVDTSSCETPSPSTATCMAPVD